MSIFSGPQYKGAMRDARAAKRTEAEARDQESAHHYQGRRAALGELDPAIYESRLDYLEGGVVVTRKPVSR
jgi:hypothetical protein